MHGLTGILHADGRLTDVQDRDTSPELPEGAELVPVRAHPEGHPARLTYDRDTQEARPVYVMSPEEAQTILLAELAARGGLDAEAAGVLRREAERIRGRSEPGATL